MGWLWKSNEITAIASNTYPYLCYTSVKLSFFSFLLEMSPPLQCVPPEAEPERRSWAQVAYLGREPKKGGKWDRNEKGVNARYVNKLAVTVGDWGSVSRVRAGRLCRLEHAWKGEEVKGIYPPNSVHFSWGLLSQTLIPGTSVLLSALGKVLRSKIRGVCSKKPRAPLWMVRTFPWKNILNSHIYSHPCSVIFYNVVKHLWVLENIAYLVNILSPK